MRMPRDSPSVHVPTARPTNITTSGLVANRIIAWYSAGAFATAGSTEVAISTTGSNAVANALNAPGSRAVSMGGAENSVTGRDRTLRNSRANTGPATIM